MFSEMAQFCQWGRRRGLVGAIRVRVSAKFHDYRRRSTIAASPEKGPDLVVVAEKRDVDLSASVLENEPEITVTAALEKLVA